MSEHIKFIVNEINNYLKTNYNLISFDSLSNEGLLQVLVDSFAYFEAVPKVRPNYFINFNNATNSYSNSLMLESWNLR